MTTAALQHGDAQIGLDLLAREHRMLALAERDYAKHPAANNFERLVNQERSAEAGRRRASIERLMGLLADAIPANHQPERTT